jgi:hypothetical protein
MVRAARKAGLGVPDFLFAIGLATLEILELETRLGAWNQRPERRRPEVMINLKNWEHTP